MRELSLPSYIGIIEGTPSPGHQRNNEQRWPENPVHSLTTYQILNRLNVLNITSLDGKQVKFHQMQSLSPTKIYAITGVPTDVNPEYVIGMHNITKQYGSPREQPRTRAWYSRRNTPYQTNSE
jgi:hypothetical protein